MGIIALNCLGEVFALPNIVPVQDKYGGRFEDEMQFDPSVINKLKVLYIAKETAVKNMEYEEAITIKNAIAQMKKYGVILNQLEEKKKKYMVKKKYELANDCNKEIKMMREIISNPNKIFNSETIFQKVSDSALKNMWGGKAEYYSSKLPEHSDMLKNTALRGLNLVPLTTDIIMKDKIEKYKIPKNREDQLIKDDDEKRRIAAMEQEFLKGGFGNMPLPKPKDNFDDIVIPAIMNEKEQEEEKKYLEDLDDLKRYDLQAQDLDAETMALAQPMIGVFKLEIMKKLFAADWHLREEALRDIEREVKLGSKSALCGDMPMEEIFSATMCAVAHGISDKVAQVVYAGFDLSDTLTKNLFPTVTSATKKQLTSHVNTVVMWMLDKIGDSNARIRQYAHDSLLNMTDHNCVGVNLIIEQITKGQVKETAAKSHRHIHGRMNLLKSLLLHQRYDVNTKDVPLDTVLSYALTGFKHPKEDVRTVAYIMVFEIYKSIGKILKSYLGHIPENQLNILNQGFDLIDEGSDITANEDDVKLLMTKNKGQVQKVFGEKKASGRIKSTRQSSRGKRGSPDRQQQFDDDLSCQFCKKTGFNETSLDLHYWDQCLMLTTCFC